MPYAATHILGAIILAELFRGYFIKDNKKFPRYYILAAAIGGIIPDLDIGAYYLLYFFGFSYDQIHRTFLHTIFVPIALFSAGVFFLKTGIKSSEIRKRHLRLSTLLFIFAGGSILHLILDSILAGYIIPLYPLAYYSLGLNIVSSLPEGFRGIIAPTIDGILILFWVFWMEFKLKISDYF